MQLAASHSFAHLGVMIVLVLAAVVTFLVIKSMRSRDRNPK